MEEARAPVICALRSILLNSFLYIRLFHLRRAEIEHLGDFGVQLFDVGEALDAAGWAAVRELRVEDEFGAQVCGWWREPPAAAAASTTSPSSGHHRVLSRVPSAASSVDLLILHQARTLPRLLLSPQAQRHRVLLHQGTGGGGRKGRRGRINNPRDRYGKRESNTAFRVNNL